MPSPLIHENWLDRAIGWLNPQAAFDRRRYRWALNLSQNLARDRRGIEAVSGNRLRREWNLLTQDADAAMRFDRQKTANAVRMLALNNPFVAGALTRIVANIIGQGISPQCAVQADSPESEPYAKPPGWRPISEEEATRFQSESERLWQEFIPVADLAGKLDYYELQDLEERETLESGEVIVHFARTGREQSPTGFAIELIEADRLDTPPSRMTDPTIRDGVELDLNTGQPVAYWIKDVHPGDTTIVQVLNGYTRIPRLDDMRRPQVIHYFGHWRIGQTRGLSPFAPVLALLEDYHRLWEAVIVGQRVAACYTAFVESPAASFMRENTGDDQGDEKGQREEKMEPGKVWYGLPGEKITFGSPGKNDGQISAISEDIQRAIGVGLNLAYELFALNFSQTNYSSARAALLETRRTFQTAQRRRIGSIDRLVWNLAIEDGWTTGRLQAPAFLARRADYCASRWTPPAWGWVDPEAEVQAAVLAIQNGLSTVGDELAALGRDFDQTLAKAIREHGKYKASSLPSPYEGGIKLLPAPAPTNAPAKKPAPKEA